MGENGYKKKFKIHKFVVDFFLGAGISACWNFYWGNDDNLLLLLAASVICGIVAIGLIEGYKYLYKHTKKGKRKRGKQRRSIDKTKISW